MKQRTLVREASTSGKSLHTGQEVRLTLRPAAAGTGLIFRRVDLYGKPDIKPSVELVTELVRSTDISSGHAKVHTVEHVLSALAGCGVDNAVIEMDASEPPILDGSARGFVKLIDEAGIVEQEAEREVWALAEPVSVQQGNRSIIALPHKGLRITCTSTDDRGIHTQHLSIDIDPDVYRRDIAHARTFTIYEDIEQLVKLGKIRGGSLDSAIVIKGDKIISKEPLRYADEFVRHKILDIIGDLVLLGVPLQAHIIAVRTGHALNFELSKALRAKYVALKAAAEQAAAAPTPPKAPKPPATAADGTPVQAQAPVVLKPGDRAMDIRRIMDLAPHAYPMVLLDRILDITPEGELIAVKNVTYNEPFFPGHFPGRPVMPGVLQLEAMAQAAGILFVTTVKSEKPPVAFFMSADKVKFRAPVTPGDQLEIRVKLTRIRNGVTATAAGQCLVNGKVVSSAEMMFTMASGGETAEAGA